MTKLKRLITLLVGFVLIFTLVFAMASCGDNGGDTDTDTGSDPTTDSGAQSTGGNNQKPEDDKKPGFEATIYYVTFKQSGFEDVVIEVEEGENLNNPPKPKDEKGYTIVWDVTNFKNITDDITVNAVKTPIPLKITYVLGTNATNGTGNPATFTIEQSVALADPSREGCNFAGWYLDAAMTGSKVTEIAEGTDSDITLYAKWNPINYTITYIAGEGTFTTEQNTYNVDNNVVFEKPTPPEYMWFSQWVHEGRRIESTEGLIGDITIEARYTAAEYDITYELNGGRNNILNKSWYTYFQDDIVLQKPTYQGCEFDGWYTDKDFENKITAIQKNSSGNITLYAKWIPIEYTINYVLPNGTEGATNDNNATYNTVDGITLKAAVLDGYRFFGWYLDSEYKTQIAEFKPGTTGEKTVYGKLEKIEYVDIKFDADGGEGASEDITVEKGFTIGLFANPTKADYVFAGWYYDGKQYTPDSIATQSVTLKARWIKAEKLESTPVYTNGSDFGLGFDNSLTVSYGELKYVNQLVLVTNDRSSKLSKIKFVAYRGNATLKNEVIDTAISTEIIIPVDKQIDRFEIIAIEGSTLVSLDVYATENAENCAVNRVNIANKGVFSYENAGAFWAIDFSKLVDGDKETGTASPKGVNYSVFLSFADEHVFSKLVLTCNGKGKTSEGGNYSEVQYNNPGITVRMYDAFGVLVYDSEYIDTTSLEEVVVAPYILASRIEFVIRGNGMRGGNEYLWEVETYIEEGEHSFDCVGTVSPTCNADGKYLYSCACGYETEVTIPKTVLHVWNDGSVTDYPSETANGTMTYTCTLCGATKTNDIPATEHNYVKGETVAPTCTELGYTVYRCSDGGCDASYKADYVEAYGHLWDEGVVTKRPTNTEEGIKTFTCTRGDCGQTKTESIRKVLLSTNKFQITADNVADIITDINADNKYAIIDGKTDSGNHWRGATGSTLDILLDGYYYITSASFYIWSNHNSIKIQLFAPNPYFDTTAPESDTNVKWIEVASYSNGGFSDTDLSRPTIDMTNSLNGGKKVGRILFTTVSDKGGGTGYSGIKYYEMVLEAHECELTEEDHIEDENYIAATCTQDGSCNAKCIVCGEISNITLESDKYGHKYGDLIVDTPASCSKTGIGHYICTEVGCGHRSADVVIPKTHDHSFTLDVIKIAPTCKTTGIGERVCEDCGAVCYQYTIPVTEHFYIPKNEDDEYCDYCGEQKD